MNRQMSISGKKHWTSSQIYEKINRYTFLDRSSILIDSGPRRKVVKQITFPEKNIGLFGVRFNAEGTRVIASYGTGTIQIMDVDLGTPLYYVRTSSDPTHPIMAIRCMGEASDIFYAAGICGKIYMCKFQENSYRIFAEEKSNEINAMDLDPNSDIMATGGKDGAIRLYDIKTGKLLVKLGQSSRSIGPNNTSFHTRRIFSIKFDVKRENLFLSGGWDDCVKIWDVRNNEGCIRNINGPHICGDAVDVKDNTILTGQWTAENALQLWDFGSGKLMANISPINRVQSLDGEFVYCCRFFKCEGYGDTVVAGGSGTGYLDVITLPDERIISTFKVNKLVQALDTTDDSKIAYGGMENILNIANLALPQKSIN